MVTMLPGCFCTVPLFQGKYSHGSCQNVLDFPIPVLNLSIFIAFTGNNNVITYLAM